MADRYWVGGTATWDATAGTKWSTTDGGAGGAAVPTSADNVYFTALSGAVTVTTGASVCGDINCTGFTGTIALANGTQISCYGSLTFASTMSFSDLGGNSGTYINMLGTGVHTITSAGKLGATLQFNGTGQWTLQDALTSSGGITHNSGTFISNNYSIGRTITSGGSSVRTMNLGTSSITATSNGGGFSFTGTNLTLIANNATFNCFNGPTITLDSLYTIGNVTLTSANSITFTSNTNSIGTIAGNLSVKRGASIIFNKGCTITGQIISPDAASAISRFSIVSNTVGLTRDLVINAAQTISDIDFRDIAVSGTAAPISGTRLSNLGGNSGITFSAAKTVYWNLAAGGNWNSTAWALTSGGTPDVNNFPLAQDTAIVQNTGLNTSATITINASYYVSTIDMSSRTNAMTFAVGTNQITFFGDFKSGTNTTYSGVSTFSFNGRGNNQYILSNGRTLTQYINIDKIDGGEVQLLDAFSQNAGCFITITRGAFRTNNYACSAGRFVSSTSNVRGLYFGNSTIVSNSSQSVWSISSNENFTFDAGTSNITFTDSGNNTTNFSIPSGTTFYNVTLASGFTNSISGNDRVLSAIGCTFNNLTIGSTGGTGVARWKVYGDFTVNGTLTLNNGGSITQRCYLISDTFGTQRTITANAVVANYCDFRDIKIAGSASNTSLYAGNLGNNSGITFPAPKSVYWNLAGSQNFSAAGWALTSGGTPNAANYPLAQDTAVFDNAGAVGTVTVDSFWQIGTLDFSARTSAMTFSVGTTTLQLAKDLKLGSGVTWTSTAGTVSFISNGGLDHTITSNGCVIGCNVAINTDYDKVLLADALTLATGSTTLSVNTGAFLAVTYNVTAGAYSTPTTSGVRNIYTHMGSGTWTLTGTGTVFSAASSQTGGGDVDAGTANVVLSDTSASARAVTLGVVSLNKLTIGGTTGTSTLTITGGGIQATSSIGELASTKTVAHTISFAASTTHRIGKWSVTGTAGNVVTVTGGASSTLSISGDPVTGVDYLSFSTVTGSTSGGTFYAGANSASTTTGFVLTAATASRTLYWVGGTGNWSSTAHWDTVSGGGGGAAIPTQLDDVVFNTASNATAYTVTVDAYAYCRNITIGAPASGNLTWAGSFGMTITGDTTIAGSGVTRTYSGTVQFSSGVGRNINGNGISISTGTHTFLGIRNTWTFGSAYTSSASLFQLFQGYLNTAGYAMTISRFVTRVQNNDGIHEYVGLTLGASTLTVNSSGVGTSSLTLKSFAPTAAGQASKNFTLNAGTSTIVSTDSTSVTLNIEGLTLYNLTLNTPITIPACTITGTLTLVAPAAAGYNLYKFRSPITSLNPRMHAPAMTIGMLICSGASAIQRVQLTSDTFGATRTIAVSTYSAPADVDFQDIAFTGAASPVSGTRLGDTKGNSGITFPAPKTVYWNLAGSQNWSATGWATTSTGTPAVNNFPLAQDTAVFTDAGAAGTVTINAGWAIPSMDMSGRTSAMTFAFSGNPTAYGDYKFGTGVTNTSNGNTVTFSGRNTQTILSNGVVFGQIVNINSPGGTVQFGDAFTLNSSRSFTLTYGTLNAGIYSVTLPNFACAATSSTVLTMGSGLWTLTGTGTPWNITATSTALTINKGSANILLSDTSTTSRTFAGNGFSYNKLTIGGATGVSTLTITGNNTFTEIASTKTVAHTIALGSTIQKIGKWSVSGTSGNVVTLSGSPAQLLLTGSPINNVDYLLIDGVQAFPSATTWYVGTNSTRIGSYGFIFTANPGTIKGIVYSGGLLQEYTSSGARVRLDTGLLKTTAGGVSLVWDKDLKILRQAAAGETVITP